MRYMVSSSEKGLARIVPSALITGISGQDGSYLAELLLSKSYRVVGTTRDLSARQHRISHLREKIEVVEIDLTNQESVENLLRRYQPDEVYNLAARASSSELWKHPVLMGELNALSVVRILDAIHKIDSSVRFVQASSSEVFGDATEVPQTEATPFRPLNPYGVAKAYGHWITTVFRQHHDLFACSCILYNHESPRRGLEFVSRKISHAAAKITLGKAKELRLGCLSARRDWGFAGDYVQAMWSALQQKNPDDYVIATGETHSVRDFCDVAFARVGLDYREFVTEEVISDRDLEIGLRIGDASKAHLHLGWKHTVGFEDLVRMMVDADLKIIQDYEASERKTSASTLACRPA
jgi:GDPmannose 4,6-dehydratase